MTSKGATEKTAEKPQEMADDAISNLSRAQYDDQLDSHQTLLQAKNAELTRLTEMLRSVRELKEPLSKIKATLQVEINDANKAINAKAEEVTLIKQKLRYHSVKQITENIERLEYQLRNNNYKPREEQKILDEISMLQRSTKTLREYEGKQVENKKFRSERARLIDERNSNFSKIKALYAQEDEIKKAMVELRGVISNSKKSIDQLRQMKPTLEKKWVSQQQPARNKRYEDKRRQRQEQFKPRDHQETRRKAWEKYEASREPYEEECDMCRVLITYLQSSMNSNFATPTSSRATPTPTTPLETPSTPASDPDYVGSFYIKPRDDDGFTRVSKREKAKAKREHRLARRVKELPHTPDVLLKFTKLSISPPKNTDEIPAAVIGLQDALQRYHILYLEEKKNNGKEKEKEGRTDENTKCVRPTSLAIAVPQLLITSATDSATSSTPSQLEPMMSPLDNRGRCMAMSAPPTPLQPERVVRPLDRGRSLATATPSSPLRPEFMSSSLDRGRSLDSPLRPLNANIVSLTGQSLESHKPQANSSMVSPAMSWAAVATSSTPSQLEPMMSPLDNRGRCMAMSAPPTPLQPERVVSPLDRGRSLATATPSSPLRPEFMSSSLDRGRSLDSPLRPLNANIVSLTGQSLESHKSQADSSMVSPAMSWAAVATKKLVSPEPTSLLCEIPVVQPGVSGMNQEIMCNGAQSPEVISEPPQFCVPTLSDQREETKMCNGILPLGDNESFFSTPISYSNNLVEVNNNAARSYANVTAKMKVAAVDF